jgi:ATP:corrinoid adenosyltransferase
MGDDTFDRNRLYDQYHELKKEKINIIANNFEIENIKSKLENQSYDGVSNDKIMYPDYQNKNFIQEISKNMEFKYYKNQLDISEMEKKCDNQYEEFELDNHQKFLGNFMNNKTPYKGLLIFHGVGTGKTCSAITISNNFRSLNSKIIVMVSDTIKPGWIKNIYNEKLGEDQCSGDYIHKMLDVNKDELYQNSEKLKRKITRKINEYYEFFGYQKFSNETKKLVSEKINHLFFHLLTF